MSEQLHYSLVIQWSDEDQAYIVSFPEWEAHGLIGHSHGDSYEEAITQGQDVLRMLIESARRDAETLPVPQTFAGAKYINR